MGAVVEVTSPTFEEAVLEQSFQKPVVIDFFAQWCGPCQLLKPLLEKLTQDYDFVLAKVDIDESPELARIYQVEGVPDVKVALQGQVYNGFVGMLPEPQLREFLEQLDLKSTFDEAMESLAAVKATGNKQQLSETYTALLSTYSDRPELVLEAAQFFLTQGNLSEAETLLDNVDPLQRPYGDQAVAMRSLIEFHQIAAELTPATEADQLYWAGAKAAISDDYETAMEQFLTLVERDRKYREDAGRKALLTLFGVLGNDHPLTQTYRKRLMQTLY
ncbi:tetratricopeptide repeat protein [Oscillatoria sp. CS-180]|uniref:tetratricopeptide repeat protein n=1 Tax=Oscillatoria sp. CS-180 TaxID=3021720 RepID=UPI00232C13EF|nr:tetratricopeptide repeat protein [Oscillatoria sp. CS-180]MDB9528105.1 tetratricopeptide repeat protein [Oscillatoria sp. CS-180]